MKYKTCVSIAENSSSKVVQKLKMALKKSDYVEIRFDFLKTDEIPKTLETIKGDIKRIVCTLRPRTEGGKFKGSEKERIAILKLIAEYNPFLIDVEFNTVKKNKEFARYLKTTKTKMLISWHDFRKTPSLSELEKKIKDMSKFSSNVKIVTTAKSIEDSTRILQTYRKNNIDNLIAFAMGDMGRISRILCLYFGSPYTYVTLGKPIAPGQFNVDQVKRITGLEI
jgi:3-dehydroquinate dehydratase-1